VAHFVIEYADLGAEAAREAGRADHIGYRKGLGPRLALAGPLLDPAGRPTGSLVIVEADDEAAAQALAQADPYVAAGVLELVSLRRYRIAAMVPPAR
jgi:hypothetical protein